LQEQEKSIQTDIGEPESDSVNTGENTFSIYQVKEGDEYRNFRFVSTKELEAFEARIDCANYDLVYTAPLDEHVDIIAEPYPTLNSIYNAFNLEHPDDYTGRSISMSDVILFNHKDDTSSFYVNNVGFTKIDIDAFLGGKEYAKQNNQLNSECSQAIDKAIADSMIKPNQYDLKTAVRSVIDQYGTDRTAIILASNVKAADWDRRFSDATKEWAKGAEILTDPKVYLQSHRTLLEGFIKRFREAEKEKPSVLSTLAGNEQKAKQRFGEKANPAKDTHNRKKEGEEL